MVSEWLLQVWAAGNERVASPNTLPVWTFMYLIFLPFIFSWLIYSTTPFSPSLDSILSFWPLLTLNAKHTILKIYIRENMWPLSLLTRITLLSIIFSRSTHYTADFITSFLFTFESNSIVNMYHISLSIHLLKNFSWFSFIKVLYYCGFYKILCHGWILKLWSHILASWLHISGNFSLLFLSMLALRPTSACLW